MRSANEIVQTARGSFVLSMLFLSESRERKQDIAAACLASTAEQTFDLSRRKNPFCISIQQENYFRPTRNSTYFIFMVFLQGFNHNIINILSVYFCYHFLVTWIFNTVLETIFAWTPI